MIDWLGAALLIVLTFGGMGLLLWVASFVVRRPACDCQHGDPMTWHYESKETREFAVPADETPETP